MGGGGGTSGAEKTSVFGREKARTVETTYTEGSGWTRGRYKDTVLQANDLGNGNVELVYAQADSYSKTAKTNKTNYVTYTLDHGFVNSTPHNLNFDNALDFCFHCRKQK
ncbi:MAG: hypothetical protein LUC89_08845 [Oscillospiraceae bacterium]|nr:hypothetical protein [Oscillospiraceae bacterium]